MKKKDMILVTGTLVAGVALALTGMILSGNSYARGYGYRYRNNVMNPNELHIDISNEMKSRMKELDKMSDRLQDANRKMNRSINNANKKIDREMKKLNGESFFDKIMNSFKDKFEGKNTNKTNRKNISITTEDVEVSAQDKNDVKSKKVNVEINENGDVRTYELFLEKENENWVITNEDTLNVLEADKNIIENLKNDIAAYRGSNFTLKYNYFTSNSTSSADEEISEETTEEINE